MAFQQGLSGLNSSARALDVISSNVANAATAGFKASSTVFADAFASAMGGGSTSAQVGMGSVNQAVRQSFTQGAVTATGNSLDMAIGGNGFFVIQRGNDTVAYTRNGQFDLDKNGYVVTALGERLMGYQSVGSDGMVSYIGSTTPRPLYVPPQGIAAKATGNTGAAVTVRANLDSQLEVPATSPFDVNDPDSYSFATSVAVYDSLGNQHSLNMYFVREAPTTSNTWGVYTTFDNSAPTTQSDIVFDSTTGAWESGGEGTISIPAATLGTGAADLSFDYDLSQFTQRRADSAVYETTQDGSPPGEVASVSISADGIMQASYTNGQTRELGRVILATFRNPNGLSSLGDNLWGETIDSGSPAVAAPGEGLNGTISSGRIEESNVDMSQELVQMIIQQRNYQANAQSIKTQDQLLQTLISMR